MGLASKPSLQFLGDFLHKPGEWLLWCRHVQSDNNPWMERHRTESIHVDSCLYCGSSARCNLQIACWMATSNKQRLTKGSRLSSIPVDKVDNAEKFSLTAAYEITSNWLPLHDPRFGSSEATKKGISTSRRCCKICKLILIAAYGPWINIGPNFYTHDPCSPCCGSAARCNLQMAEWKHGSSCSTSGRDLPWMILDPNNRQRTQLATSENFMHGNCFSSLLPKLHFSC